MYVKVDNELLEYLVSIAEIRSELYTIESDSDANVSLGRLLTLYSELYKELVKRMQQNQKEVA